MPAVEFQKQELLQLRQELEVANKRIEALEAELSRRIGQETKIRLRADAFRLCAHGTAIGAPGINVVLTCNEAFARMRGQSVKEIEGSSIVSLYAPEDQQMVKDKLKITDSTGFCSCQAKMMRKDGTIFPVQIDVVGLKDENGQIMYRIVTVQDSTERLESQSALRESEERFRSVVESAPDAIFIQTGGRFAYLNHSAIALFGASKAEEILGRRVADQIHPDYRDLVAERIRLLNERQ